MSAELVIFYVLAAGAVGSAAAMLLPTTGRNPIHSALLLIAALFCLAGLYALLSAHLLTALQIIVYAGAIMVLFTFVIMLLNLSPNEILPAKLTLTKIVAGVLGLFVFGKLLTALTIASAGAKAVDLADPVYANYGTIKTVGRMLYSTFMVPFELASVLLLVAAVAAVALAKKSLKYVDAPVPPPAKLTRLAHKGDDHDAEAGDGHHGGGHH
ncbi:MAG: NADH-quinone oxidoreductase subunit J [Deltaproteobacteria bacterium]|nr:NADH-quinone oxidoreductase subunit J [Deltaproteobacteria bacterium]